MKRFYCFKCGSRFLSDAKKLSKFNNEYGDWNGIRCQCGGMAKHIGQVFNVATGRQTRLQEQRDVYKKDLIQPFIGGEKFNPEFKKAYPQESLEMVKSGSITKKEFLNAE